MFFRMSPDLFCVIDGKGHLLRINPAWEEILGYTTEELLGQSIEPLLHPDDITGTFQEVGKLAQGKATMSYVNRYRHKDGTYRHIDWRARLCEEDGFIYGIGRDISDSRFIQSQLERSESKYRKIFENIQDVYLMADLDGKIREISPSVEQTFLYDRDELLGSPASALYAEPSQRSVMIKALKETGELNDFEIWYKKKNNELFLGSVSAHQIYDKNYNPIGIEGIIHDITERKKVEDELKKLLRAVEQSPVTIVITDPNGSIEYANPKTFETTGYTFEELRGQNPRVLKSGETSPQEYDNLWKTILSGKLWQGTFHNRRKNGELYWESAAISPVYDSTGKIAHFIAVKEDITERKLAQDALREASATKDKLFSIISHDLRGPIGNMMPMIEILLTQPDLTEDQRNDYLQILKNASERIYSLLENLLGWSRSQQNKLFLRPRNLSAAELINNNLELLQASARQKNIELKFQPKPDYGIFADENSIDLVIRNLISNAIKFTPVNGTISVSIKPDEGHVTFEIADTGVGMSQGTIENLFRPEVFTTTYGTANEKGTGLGLKLCADFVSKNGGSIWAESTEGEGSRFYFTLPGSK